MSILKSPVFYIGLLLVALVVTALAAPFVIDWTAYRSTLEQFGATYSGRKVVIAGPIAVRLFPWPRLEAANVAVGNPDGFGTAPFLQANKVTINLALSGLTSGQLKVEGIVLEQPVLDVQLDSNGNGNWHFSPEPSASQNSLVAGVQLDQITVEGGEINVNDLRHGWARKLRKVNGLISGAGLDGPWKGKGEGVLAQTTGAEVPLELSFSTGAAKSNEPLGFSFKVVPLDGSYPSVAFDGNGQRGRYDGKVSFEPVVTANRKSAPAGFLKPLSTAAKISGDGDHVSLSAIHIVAADPTDAGTLIEGDGQIDLRQGLRATVNLNAPYIDLDALGGDSLGRLSDTGGAMGLANRLMQQCPETLDLTANLTVAALTFGGEVVQNVTYKSTAGAAALRIQDLTADLPGLSRMKFSGIVFPGPSTAELGGSLAFETGDARTFSNWAWPQIKEGVGKFWTGQRGHLKLQGDATWSARQFGLQNVNYELDGLPGKASLLLSTGTTPALDLMLQSNDFDLGSYVPTGFSPMGLVTSFPSVLPGENGLRKKIDVSFGRLSLNGVAAQNIDVNINASASGFEVKHFDIGNVEGAELRGNGLVLVGADGPTGEIKFAVGAQRPQGLLRLLGLVSKGPDPAWMQALGQTNLLADFSVKAGKTEPQFDGSLSGTSGNLKIVASGTARDVLSKDGVNLGLSGTVSSGDARDLLRLFGLQPTGAAAGDGQISLTVQGRPAAPFRVALDFSGLGTSVLFDGTAFLSQPFLGLAGVMKITSEHARQLLASIGSPVDGGDISLQLETKLERQNEVLNLSALSMALGNQTLVGSGQVTADHAIRVDLSGGNLRVGQLAALALAPWNGVGTFPSGRFAASWPFGLTGELRLQPDALTDPFGVALRGIDLRLSATTQQRGLSFKAKNATGVPAEINMQLVQKDAAFQVTGTASYPITLQNAYASGAKSAAVSGDTVFSGQFMGEGYSPVALLRGISGEGVLSATNVVVNELAPDPFYAAAREAKSGDDLSAAFSALNKGAGVGFAPQDLKCDIKAGNVTCGSFSAQTSEAEIGFTPTADLAEGTVAGEVALVSKTQPTLPPLRLLLSGSPGAVTRRLDVAALSAKLGTALINKDMEELARLQKEQVQADAEAAIQSENDKAKYDAFQAQRSELRLQTRMIKVFAQQRALDAARAKAVLDAAVLYGMSITKDEKRRLLQALPH